MLDNAEHFLCTKLGRFWPNIITAASAHDLDPYLLGALVLTESAAEPYAMRVEAGFWHRYGPRILRRARLAAPHEEDTWLNYPDVASASYGLCQILYPVAREFGVRLNYPTQLCDPQLNLDLGATILARHLRRTTDDVTEALLRYNGGSSPLYADTVLRWRDHLLRSPIIRDLNAIRGRHT